MLLLSRPLNKVSGLVKLLSRTNYSYSPIYLFITYLFIYYVKILNRGFRQKNIDAYKAVTR